MKFLALSTGLLALMLSTAHADPCADAQGQAATSECAGSSYEASDAELNRLYRQIEVRLRNDTDTSKQLVSAQRAWLAFRDAECGFSSSKVTGGSAYPMVHSMCLDSLTKNRIHDLRRYLSCEEGELSCPVSRAN